MGQACCKYAGTDTANENFGEKTIQKGGAKLYVLDAE
jgi:hypothetical protein